MAYSACVARLVLFAAVVVFVVLLVVFLFLFA